METHKVKCLPQYFNEQNKNFIIRLDDRNYNVGDIIIKCEWAEIERTDIADGYIYTDWQYTGKEKKYKIIYKLNNCQGLEKGYCILGLGKMKNGNNYKQN